MSELINYDVIEKKFGEYFEEHDENFQELFKSFDSLDEFSEYHFVVFPEKMYDQFPAKIIMSMDGHRVFEDELPDSVKNAIKHISYLPNVVDFDDIDPEAFGVKCPDGRVVGLYLIVRDLIKKFLARSLPKRMREITTIGLHDEEQMPIVSNSSFS